MKFCGLMAALVTFPGAESRANPSAMVEVWVRSGGSVLDSPERYVDLPYVISGTLTAVTVTADRAAPQPAGTTITLTAAAVGGASVQYKWWVFAPATGWTAFQF